MRDEGRKRSDHTHTHTQMDTTCVMKEEHQVITHTHTDGHNMRDEGRTPSDHTHTHTQMDTTCVMKEEHQVNANRVPCEKVRIVIINIR